MNNQSLNVSQTVYSRKSRKNNDVIAKPCFKSCSAPARLENTCKIKIYSYTNDQKVVSQSLTISTDLITNSQLTDSLGELLERDIKPINICFDFDCTLTSSEERSGYIRGTKIPNAHFYWSMVHTDQGRALRELFADFGNGFPSFESLNNAVCGYYEPFEDWCLSFYGTPERLDKLQNLFSTLKKYGHCIYILTRGHPFYTSCMLHWANLLKYVDGVNGNNSIGVPVWYDVSEGVLSAPIEHKYQTKDDFIKEQLRQGKPVLYVDDDDQEHHAVIKEIINDNIGDLSAHKNCYYNVGQACGTEDDVLKSQCLDFSNFSKNGDGISFEMMDMILEICQRT